MPSNQTFIIAAYALTWVVLLGYAFRLWRRERGRSVPALGDGLEPEAGRDLRLAPDEEHLLPHPRAGVAEIVTGWALVFGALYGFGMLVSHYAGGSFVEGLDTVPFYTEELDLRRRFGSACCPTGKRFPTTSSRRTRTWSPSGSPRSTASSAATSTSPWCRRPPRSCASARLPILRGERSS